MTTMSTPVDAQPAEQPSRQAGFAPTRPRIASLDVIRGAVMVLMAIDHVRVYSGVPPGGPTAGVFLTRWVTHFCAPAFVFLAGTAAFLYARRARDPRAVSQFLLTRGIWLILLELTVLRIGWTFNFDYSTYLLAGVIWMIGWCLVLMAVLSRLPLGVVGVIGVAMIGLHDLTDLVPRATFGPVLQSGAGWFWRLLYFGGPIELVTGGPTMAVLYSIVPWVGVMAAGWAFGAVFDLDPARRRRICLMIGTVAVAAFLVLRGFDLYGAPRPWQGAQGVPGWIAFLGTTKYPASLLFLLMTLGPTILLVPLLEQARGPVANALAVFGRVPFFYYLLHIPLIHLLAIGVAAIRSPGALPWLFDDHPMMMAPAPEGYRWSLPLLYAVFAVAVGLLYFPCRWFAGLKALRSDRWLSYL